MTGGHQIAGLIGRRAAPVLFRHKRPRKKFFVPQPPQGEGIIRAKTLGVTTACQILRTLGFKATIFSTTASRLSTIDRIVDPRRCRSSSASLSSAGLTLFSS